MILMTFHIGLNIIGTIVEEDGQRILQKSVVSQQHMLRKPPSWCWAVSVIEEAYDYSVDLIRITDRNSGKMWTVPFETFVQHSMVIDRGHGEQLALSLDYWKVE